MWSAILIFVDAASAHGDEFGVSALTARTDAPEEVWAAVDGWGLIHSTDSAASFDWICDEAIGTETVYDLLAWEDGVAFVGTVDGVLRVDETCSGTSVTGLGEGFVLDLVRWQDHAVAALIGPERGGIYLCDDAGCAPTPLEGAAYYPKSLAVDGDTLWITLVHTDTLAAELYRTTDGVTFTPVHSWPDADTDPRLLWAHGDTVYLWTRPRDAASEPGFSRSTDGGATFTETFTTGYYTDPTPGSLVRDDGATVLVGSWYGARTWGSTDGGAHFTEVTETAPALKCSVDLGDHALTCNDHLADGFDISSTTDAVDFTPLTCLDEVRPAECAEATCEPYLDAWITAGAYGGGRCHPDTGDTGTPDTPPCGCETAPNAGISLLAAGLAWVARRRT